MDSNQQQPPPSTPQIVEAFVLVKDGKYWNAFLGSFISEITMNSLVMNRGLADCVAKSHGATIEPRLIIDPQGGCVVVLPSAEAAKFALECVVGVIRDGDDEDIAAQATAEIIAPFKSALSRATQKG